MIVILRNHIRGARTFSGRAARWAIRRAAVQARVFAAGGLRANLAYLRMRWSPSELEHQFANGLRTTIDPRSTRRWALLAHPMVVALMGSPVSDVSAWIRRVNQVTGARVLVNQTTADRIGVEHAGILEVHPVAQELAGADLRVLRAWMIQHHRHWDLAIVDAAEPLPDPFALLRLQHSVHDYEGPHGSVGIAVPRLRSGDAELSGWEWDVLARRWSARPRPDRDWGHGSIPRYVLRAPAHGAVVSWRLLDRADMPATRFGAIPFDRQFWRLQGDAWRAHLRTLAFGVVALDVRALPPLPEVDQDDREWLCGRSLTSRDGRVRVIYLLPYTGISGGIRTVFEQSDQLLERGFDVEIWSLGGNPDWLEHQVLVRTFRSYHDLLVLLRDEDAIKVATWWESTQVVWLSAVARGVAVNYVQEFETWFYPDNPDARAAVASSYRREMVNVTIADYQKSELAEVGVDATTISSAFDDRIFGELDGVSRSEDEMLAVGRSFFQKNFAMTLAAWRSLGEQRPPLTLFGFEPDLVTDDRIHYEVKPTSTRVNELYNRAAFFVQTSRHEGFALPLIEAMAAGCPVITTDSHGNRDFCVDGENCLMVEQDDVQGLVDAIQRLRSEPELRQSLARAGLDTASRHTWTRVSERLALLFTSLSERSAVE